jgi:hypothetical protein
LAATLRRDDALCLQMLKESNKKKLLGAWLKLQCDMHSSCCMLNTNWAQMPTTASKLQLNVGVLELNSSEVATKGGIMENSISNCRRHDHQLVISAMLWSHALTETLLDLSMKCSNLHKGSKVIIVVVQVGAVKINVAAVEVLRKKERQVETKSNNWSCADELKV